jgi:preprotein translocase subunit SecG
MTWPQWLLGALITFVCFLLIIVILLQKGRGGGMAGAFGGAGGTSAFGAKTGDVFTWITVIGAGIFVLLTVVGNFAFDVGAVPSTPTVESVPAEGPPAGPQPGKAMPISIETVDPATGEKKIIPLDGVPGAGGAQPIQIQPPTTPPAGSGEVKPEPKPAEAQPSKPAEPKKEETAPATP